MHKYGKIDANQPEIVKALEQIGCSVQSLASTGNGCPDLLVGVHGLNILFEIKDGSKPPSARKLTPEEYIWQQNWRGQVHTVESADEAMDVLNRRVRV